MTMTAPSDSRPSRIRRSGSLMDGTLAGEMFRGDHTRNRDAAAAGHPGERLGAAQRCLAGIVVEVDENVRVGAVPEVVLNSVQPGCEGGPAVERPDPTSALVEPQVAPVGGPPERSDRSA